MRAAKTIGLLTVAVTQFAAACSSSHATLTRTLGPDKICSAVDLKLAAGIVGAQLPTSPHTRATPYPNEVSSCEWHSGDPNDTEHFHPWMAVDLYRDTGDAAWQTWIRVAHDQCDAGEPQPTAVDVKTAAAAYKDPCRSMNTVVLREGGYFLTVVAAPHERDPDAQKLTSFAAELANRILRPRAD